MGKYSNRQGMKLLARHLRAEGSLAGRAALTSDMQLSQGQTVWEGPGFPRAAQEAPGTQVGHRI